MEILAQESTAKSWMVLPIQILFLNLSLTLVILATKNKNNRRSLIRSRQRDLWIEKKINWMRRYAIRVYNVKNYFLGYALNCISNKKYKRRISTTNSIMQTFLRKSKISVEIYAKKSWRPVTVINTILMKNIKSLFRYSWIPNKKIL